MNDVIYLLEIKTSVDENGFEVSTEVETKVYAKKKSIRATDHYESQKLGYKLSNTFIIKPYEYLEQEYVKYKDIKYSIERTYEKDTENLELVCSRVK